MLWFNYIYEHALFYRVLLNDFNRLNLLDEELGDVREKEIEPAIRIGKNITDADLRIIDLNTSIQGLLVSPRDDGIQIVRCNG